MSEQARFMLVASPLMENSPAFDRAAALARAEDAALHIVAFDYLEGLATASLVNEQALEQMRLGYVERHRQWLEEQARPMRKLGVTVTTEVVWVQNPLQEILTHLKEQPMALLIKALEHQSRLSRVFFTPWISTCCASARCPCILSAIYSMRCHARSSQRSTRSIAMVSTRTSTTGYCMKPRNWPAPVTPNST